MNTHELQDLFESHRGEYLSFKDIEVKRARRADLHAFIMLDELVEPSHEDDDIVSCSGHDIIYLGLTAKQLAAANPTMEQVIDLIRCGVLMNVDCQLYMNT
jgi:hypothetical protein